MSSEREMNLALFIDFDNVALGARDARQRFEIKLLMHRILEKGKVIVKRAYADWHFYKDHMIALHEAAIELIEVPAPRISGKNSADIKMVVDAMDVCYSKHHIDAFVLVTGDSDFSPLVSKLRENGKRVIGVGMKNSSSKLLIGNCDEFIFYDDIYRQARGRTTRPVIGVSGEKGELFDFLVDTVQSLLQESRGVLYGSLIKDTMTRKKPDFNERVYGYSTFGDLLEEARNLGLLLVERDARAGGTWVVQGLGAGTTVQDAGEKPATSQSRSSRRRRRSSGNGGRSRPEQASAAPKVQEPSSRTAPPTAENINNPVKPVEPQMRPGKSAPSSPPAGQKAPLSAEPKGDSGASRAVTKVVARKSPPKKKVVKKTPVKKTPTKKVSTTKAGAKKKTTTKKAPTKKTPAKKTVTKKTRKKTPIRKKTTG